LEERADGGGIGEIELGAGTDEDFRITSPAQLAEDGAADEAIMARDENGLGSHRGRNVHGLRGDARVVFGFQKKWGLGRGERVFRGK